MIRIMKASAGSGKTFQLAKTYIRLLLASGDPYAYRHILAVTFTNKATDEMKSRIVRELHILAQEPQNSAYYKDFTAEFGSEEQVSGLARKLLTNMLHDYSAFAVSTIDRFFQRTLKAFAREIGHFASYQVELDKQSLVHESVDRILDGLTEGDKDLLDWLTRSVMDQLEQGGHFNLESRLYEMADALKSDRYRDIVREFRIDEKDSYSKENLLALRKCCRQIRKDFLSDVKSAAQKALDVLSAAGVDPADSYKKNLNKLTVYAGIGEKEKIVPPKETWVVWAGDPAQWFPKAKAARLLPKVNGTLNGPLDDFCALFGQPWRVYNTALVLLGQIYSLGISRELFREFDALTEEKNVLSLDDSNVILSRIIAGSDAPFVYEKLGVRFEHFLLDEFQDTSTVQWQNFCPLLKESNDNGHDNLIVGDVKQSIYRWRGSDWNLLDSKVKEAFGDADDGSPLADNWRSSRTVVEFNNGFFPFVAGRLDRQLGTDLISRIYADVRQTPKNPKWDPGHLKFTFCDAEEQLDEVYASILAALESGASYSQVAVLVRYNEAGSAIAGFLVDKGIPVISDDSLRVKSSVTVRRLVSLLSHVENRNDKIAGYLADAIGLTVPDSCHSLVDLAETLLRSLRETDRDLFDGEVLFIQSFMDELQEWVSVHGNNLGAFLKAWNDDGKNPSISSPSGTDAVRIMTIHKAKGLEYPYVIIPFVEKMKLFRPDTCWSRPETTGTALDTVANGAYRVNMTRGTGDTLFAGDYEKERVLQYIDNVNTLYVALTRAEAVLHVISAEPSDKCKTACDDCDDCFDFTNLSELLYWYVNRFEYDPGERVDFQLIKRRETEERKDKEIPPTPRPAGYPSFPVNPASFKKPRLKLSKESADIFFEDALERSPRMKGVALHAILSETKVPEDLDGAVDAAVRQGYFDADQADRYRRFLADRIAAVRDRGWFPDDPSQVRNEQAVIGLDGTVERPDRVVVTPEGTQVIDFKFGEEDSRHHVQVCRYMRLYEGMGYGPVKGFLWYLREDGPDKIEEV